LAFLSTFLLAGSTFAVDQPQPIFLWPNGAPGETAGVGEEKDTSKPGDRLIAGKPVIRLGNISKPSIIVFAAPKGKATGAAVLVCPGGGYNILAWDLEGTEVCEWLNSVGVTGVLLKYRVPKRPGLEKHVPPLQDAQRALGLMRQRAKEWGIDPQRVGMMGFSAGAHLTAAASTSFEKRTYDPADDADKQSCRPDFALLIYPGGVAVKGEGEKLPPEIKVTAQTPPAFLAQTEDDNARVESSLAYYIALKNAKVPAEMHLYPTGGHGYGLRPSEHNISHWPQRAEEWLRALGVLKKP
ncbi:MAG TPA: alpha/beta hydrolase, partial [Verrucomicrobiae bacterium]